MAGVSRDREGHSKIRLSMKEVYCELGFGER